MRNCTGSPKEIGSQDIRSTDQLQWLNFRVSGQEISWQHLGPSIELSEKSSLASCDSAHNDMIYATHISCTDKNVYHTRISKQERQREREMINTNVKSTKVKTRQQFLD